jgi:hypothetical protein
MKRSNLILLLVVGSLVFFSSRAGAGLITLGAKASVYNPPEQGASPALMYGFLLDYEINSYFHANAGASYTSYTANGNNYTLMPITFDLIYHIMPGASLDPYIGGGLGYYSKTINGSENSRGGAQAMTGVAFHIGNFNAAIEISYILPDLSDSSSGSFAWGGWASGAAYVWVPL